ncbi:nuclear transport factor 2 family protein [Dietzia sp. NCCP-2495]|uniref:nuclear transport factor 2 family protein n=1 Tax=Dietzia sp. NCCP-2495 TaxID=2934675 RepID=UPI0022314CFD|nr:nuclear transport factor 2 family protein [Dietzia sp. NCCP-2495]
MKEQSASDVATRWMFAVVGGDYDAAVALSSSSIVYRLGEIRTYIGHEGVHDIAVDFGRLAGFLDVSIEGEVLESDGVVALRRLERYLLPSGGIEIRGCSFVEVTDGLVSRWSDYKSLATLDRIAG